MFILGDIFQGWIAL